MALDINPYVSVPIGNYQNYSVNRTINKGTQPYLNIQKDNVQLSYMNASNNNNSSSSSCGGNTICYA